MAQVKDLHQLGGKAIPDPKIKAKAEVTPKQSVKAAREKTIISRSSRLEIENTAKANLKEAKR